MVEGERPVRCQAQRADKAMTLSRLVPVIRLQVLRAYVRVRSVFRCLASVAMWFPTVGLHHGFLSQSSCGGWAPARDAVGRGP